MKKSLTLMLAFILVFALFSACSKKENVTDDPSTPSSSLEPGSSDGGEAEIEEITIWMNDSGSTGSGSKVKLVENAINAITEREIGVHLNFQWVANADYGTQLTLAIANNEAIDVATYNPATKNSFLTFYSNGALMDISDLAAEHGKEICELFGEEILATTSIDGRLYGFSTYRVLNSNMYVCIRTDVLEEIGMVEFAENMTTWSEYETIMQAILDSDVAMYPIGNATGQGLFGDVGALYGYTDEFSGNITYDVLGDSIFVIYTDQAGNVELLENRPEYLAQCQMAKRWMDAGYVWSDSAFSKDGSENMIAAKVFASYIVQSEYGVEINKSQSCSADMTCVELAKSYLSTTQGQKFGIVIPTTSKNPTAAMRFINLLYTTKELMNTITWGIEGETYVINDTGEAAYPEGTDSSTCGYHGLDFQVGNQFLDIPWAGLGADFRAASMENFLAAPRSVYMGCTVETAQHDTLRSTISAVVEEYFKPLTSGYYTDAYYEEFLQKLDSADIDEWITIYQAAVDEFMS